MTFKVGQISRKRKSGYFFFNLKKMLTPRFSRTFRQNDFYDKIIDKAIIYLMFMYEKTFYSVVARVRFNGCAVCPPAPPPPKKWLVIPLQIFLDVSVTYLGEGTERTYRP